MDDTYIFLWLFAASVVLFLQYRKNNHRRYNTYTNLFEKLGFSCMVVQPCSGQLYYQSADLRALWPQAQPYLLVLEQNIATIDAQALSLQQLVQQHSGQTMRVTFNSNTQLCFEVQAVAMAPLSPVLLLWRNVTEALQTETELRHALQLAQNANHAKGNFLANMSHELKTPLNIIIGFTEIIKQEMFGALNNAKYAEYVQAIHCSGTHLLDLITDILDMSRIEAGRYELSCAPYDPIQVIHEAATLIDPLAQHKNTTINICANDSEGSIDAYGDRRALKQILLNLLNNAVKYCPNGSSIELQYSFNHETKMQHFVVSDNGHGIPNDVVDAIGTPFVSAKRIADVVDTLREGSTGLGLSIVKSLIELHTGTLNIVSRSTGTQVHIALPLLFVPTEPAEEEILDQSA